MKTIKDILPLVEWKDVKRALEYFYPDVKGDAEPVFKKLCGLPKRKHKDQEEFIEIKTLNNLEKVSPLDDDNNYYSIYTNKYSLSFRKWAEAINIPISETTLEHRIFEDIIAHFIWEITWYGNEEETIKIGKELKDRMKEVKKEIDKDKK